MRIPDFTVGVRLRHAGVFLTIRQMFKLLYTRHVILVFSSKFTLVLIMLLSFLVPYLYLGQFILLKDFCIASIYKKDWDLIN